jgi:phosphatidylglycerophosphate synthase
VIIIARELLVTSIRLVALSGGKVIASEHLGQGEDRDARWRR